MSSISALSIITGLYCVLAIGALLVFWLLRRTKTEEQARAENKLVINTILFIAALVIIFYVLPAIILLAVNYFRMVVFGGWTRNQFFSHWYHFSFQQVHYVCDHVRHWLLTFLYRFR